jgi:biotin carboxyl carrier protein
MNNLIVTVGGKSFNIELEHTSTVDQDFGVLVDGRLITVTIPLGRLNVDEVDWLIIGGRPYEILLDREFRWIKTNKGYFAIDVQSNGDAIDTASVMSRNADGRIKAPIPGLIARILVSVGDSVEAGQALLILEAMKMENEIRAPHAGSVNVLNVVPGQSVKLGDVLAEITAFSVQN